MKKVYVIAAIVAIIVAVATYLLASTLMSEKRADEAEEIIMVAAVDIYEGTTVTEEMLTTQSIPTVAILPGAYRENQKAEIVGKVALSDVYAGEQLTLRKIVSPDSTELSKLSYRVGIKTEDDPESVNMRAVTITVTEVAGIAGNLKAGDYVDIVWTELASLSADTKTGLLNYNSTLFMQRCEILSVGTYSDNYGSSEDPMSYGLITLHMTVEDSIKLTNALVTNPAGMNLILRNPYDEEIVDPIVISSFKIAGSTQNTTSTPNQAVSPAA